MRRYWELAKSQMKVEAQYSAWYWTGMVSAVMRLMIIYYFWHAVYASKTEIASMSLEVMITYITIAMFVGNYLWGGPGNMLAEQIREGGVAVEMLRPYDLLNKLVALDTGSKISGTIREAVPLILVAFLFLHIQGPASAMAGIWFLVSMIIGLALSMWFDLIIGVLAFYTVNVFGLRMLKSGLMMFFTGSLVPISMFPGWLQMLSQFLPFQSMVYVPVSIYTGTLTGSSLYAAVGLQLMWLVVIWGVVRMIWSVAIRKITVFGG